MTAQVKIRQFVMIYCDESTAADKQNRTEQLLDSSATHGQPHYSYSKRDQSDGRKHNQQI